MVFLLLLTAPMTNVPGSTALGNGLSLQDMQVEVGRDTTRPTIPMGSGLPSQPVLLVSPPEAKGRRHYRDFIAIEFDSLTSGTSIRQVLAKYQATIVGGVPGWAGLTLYYVTVPDPGASWDDLLRLRQSVAGEQGVRKVILLEFGTTPLLRGSSDTTRPVIPDNLSLPIPSRTLSNPAHPSSRYYRDHIGIRFTPNVPGPVVRQVLSKYQATVMGGIAGLPGIVVYYVRLATPRDDWTALMALTDSIRSEPDVKGVLELQFGGDVDIRERPPPP